jgi:hypothetical protein
MIAQEIRVSLINTSTLPYGGTFYNVLLYYFSQSEKQIKHLSSEQHSNT